MHRCICKNICDAWDQMAAARQILIMFDPRRCRCHPCSPNSVSLGSSAIVKVPEQVGAAKSAPRKVGNQVPKKGSPFPRETQARVPRFPGTGSQARFPGTGSQEQVPNMLGSQARLPKQGFPARGSQARVPKKRFPSKVPRKRFPSKGSQEEVPRNRFPSKVPRNRFCKHGFQEPFSRFPGTVSQARFPGTCFSKQNKVRRTGFQASVSRKRFPGKGVQARFPASFPSKISRNMFFQAKQGSQDRFSSKCFQKRFPGRGVQARFPASWFPSKVFRKRFPSKFPSHRFPGTGAHTRFPNKFPKNRFTSKVLGKSSRALFPAKGSQGSQEQLLKQGC